MRKNSHNRILKGEPKEQYLNTILKYSRYFILFYFEFNVIF